MDLARGTEAYLLGNGALDLTLTEGTGHGPAAMAHFHLRGNALTLVMHIDSTGLTAAILYFPARRHIAFFFFRHIYTPLL